MKKQGQINSFVIMIILIFVIAMFIFMYNTIFSQLYSGFEDAIVSSQGNGTEAQIVIQDIQDAENSSWDYGILAIVIGFFISMIILSINTPISPIFYWIYIIASGASFLVGITFSAIWQTWAADPSFATTLARFPITNTLLGAYWPTVMTAIFFIILILLFGKRPTQI